MTFSEQKASFEQRISNQLHVFSELSETLTLRLLEIEQRLSKLESIGITAGASAPGQTRSMICHRARTRFLSNIRQ